MPPKSVPGAINPDVTQANIMQTVCVPNWSLSVRPPTSYTNALKLSMLKALGLPGTISVYEGDHRVEIAGGGAPRDPRNIWDQPMDEARLKDRLEAFEHRQLCSGKISLKDEQAIFLGNFWKAYDQLAPKQGWPVWK